MVDNNLNRREDEEKKRLEGRLPPGQSLTHAFPVLHYGALPEFNPHTWDFRIWGEVEQAVRWTWEEFSKLPRTEIWMDIHCVTRWSKFDTLWGGVAVRTLIEHKLVTPKPSAHFVVQHAEFGFSTNLPLDVVLADNFLLATHFNSEPLSLEHGYPLRGVVGCLRDNENLTTPYFWKGAKWLRSLEFCMEDKPGFWEQAGYHNEADIWQEQRFNDSAISSFE